MTDLKYRTEDQRLLDNDAADPRPRPVTSGDPFLPHTEAQRVAEAEYDSRLGVDPTVSGRVFRSEYDARQGIVATTTPGGLMVHPETGHLVGIEQAPTPQPLALAATVVDSTDRRRVITAEEAARRISGEFEPVVVDPEKVHHTRFLSAVAGYLGAEPNPANLEQIALLLGKIEVQLPDHEYPKMLYGRTLPAAEHGFDTHINLRHDHVGVIVNNEEDAKKLGSGWIDNPADLPKRKDDEIGKFEPAEKPKENKVEGQKTPYGDEVQRRLAKEQEDRIANQSVQRASPNATEVSRDRLAKEQENRLASQAAGQFLGRPNYKAGWDAKENVMRNADGSIDETATNRERATRGIPALA